jgi:hypothetical protein
MMCGLNPYRVVVLARLAGISLTGFYIVLYFYANLGLNSEACQYWRHCCLLIRSVDAEWESSKSVVCIWNCMAVPVFWN